MIKVIIRLAVVAGESSRLGFSPSWQGNAMKPLNAAAVVLVSWTVIRFQHGARAGTRVR